MRAFFTRPRWICAATWSRSRSTTASPMTASRNCSSSTLSVSWCAARPTSRRSTTRSKPSSRRWENAFTPSSTTTTSRFRLTCSTSIPAWCARSPSAITPASHATRLRASCASSSEKRWKVVGWRRTSSRAPTRRDGTRTKAAGGSGARLSRLRRNVPADAPQDPGGVDKDEVAQSPRPVFRRFGLDAVPRGNSLSLDVSPPGVHVLDQEMHHEVVGVLLDVEVLQQERRVAMAEIGERVARPCHVEAEILIETLGELEVARRHERLDLNGCQIAQDESSRTSLQNQLRDRFQPSTRSA